MTLWRPGPKLYALQTAAVLGYTLTAALNLPELIIDHCGPLVKNLPVLAPVLLLWLAQGTEAAMAPRAMRARARSAGGAHNTLSCRMV